ncbi:hypothetical protein ACFYS8_06350 [Kitasatospora sp. NPDC004615]|uniref:hypothetical protein n=1 Tax=unclassified Kitasatospora TaxID=2633591 RepID=UPI00369A8B06
MDTEDAPTPRREVYDAGTKDTLPGTLVRSEGDDPSTDELVNSVYDALGTTFDFFRDVYGRELPGRRGRPAAGDRPLSREVPGDVVAAGRRRGGR